MAILGIKAILGKPKKDGTSMVYVLVLFKRKKHREPTGYYVFPQNFDTKKEIVKGLKNASEINRKIREIKNRFLDQNDKLISMGDFYDINDIIKTPEKK